MPQETNEILLIKVEQLSYGFLIRKQLLVFLGSTRVWRPQDLIKDKQMVQSKQFEAAFVISLRS